MEDTLESMAAVRARYDSESLDVSTDLEALVNIQLVEGVYDDSPPGQPEAVVRFIDYPVFLTLEDGPWTLEDVAEALGVDTDDLEGFTCVVNVSLSPIVEDGQRVGNTLLANLCDQEGEWTETLFGYVRHLDGVGWTPETVLETFGIDRDAAVWEVSEVPPLDQETLDRLRDGGGNASA